MGVQRYLGTEWVTVHGPGDARRRLVWVLESGFGGLLAAPGPRAIDWVGLREAALGLPVAFPAVRAGSALVPGSATAGLASAKESERHAAMQAVQHAVAVASMLGCPHVILEPGLVPILGEIEEDDLGVPDYRWTPDRVGALLARRKVGRDAALDRACRSLYALARAFPETRFCVAPGRNLRTVADAAGLHDLFEDLHQLPLGYWHDAAVVARREQELGEAQGEMLESFGNRMEGMSLGDASPEGMYLPPGAGGVDYSLLATYVPGGASLPGVLELDLSVAPGELAGMRSCLDRYGL
jgi:sugar phosphate isomerase/epimerase